MTILILTEIFERGGLETHIVGQVTTLARRGERFIIATGSGRESVPAELFADGLCDLAMGPTVTFRELRETLKRLEDFATRHAVKVIHAHPFYSLIIGALLARRLRLPWVATVHGPVSLHGITQPLAKAALTSCVLPGAALVYGVSPETVELISMMTEAEVRLLPNAVRIPREPMRGEFGIWAWSGRLDSDKLPGLLDLLNKLAPAPPAQLRIFGTGSCRAELERFIESRPEIAAFAQLKGWSADPMATLVGCELVAGMGRVLLEGGAAGLPCLLVGYDGVKGLLNETTVAQAAWTNLSGRNAATISTEALQAEIQAWRAVPARFDLRPWVTQMRDEETVWSAYCADLRALPQREAPHLGFLDDLIRFSGGADRLAWDDSDAARIVEAVANPDLRGLRAQAAQARAETAVLREELRTARDAYAEHAALAAAVQAEVERALAQEKAQAAALREELRIACESHAEHSALAAAAQAEAAASLKGWSVAHAAAGNIHQSAVRWRDRALALEASTSWRLTGPLRRVVETLRHREKGLAPQAVPGMPPGPERVAAGMASGEARLASLPLALPIGRPDMPAASPSSPGLVLTEPKFTVERTPDSWRNGLVSIILPVYNQASFLPEAIHAVQQQSYPNWELIIVNDGSTDEFWSAVTPFLSDKRIRIFEQENQKLPSALNNGFRQAEGQFYTWTSADNIMKPHQIERLVDALCQHPFCGFVYSDYDAIDDRGAPLNDPTWRHHNRPDGTPRLHLPKSVSISNFHESGDNFVGASFLWRADVHHVVGAHDENMFGGEDYDFWLRMHLVTPFCHLSESLYAYRVHDNTLNARAKELNIFENVRRLLQEDTNRRQRILVNPTLLHTSSIVGYFRDPRQYRQITNGLIEEIDLLRTDKDEPKRPGTIRVVHIAGDVRKICRGRLNNADIIVTDSVLSYAWLRQQTLPPYIRLLMAPAGSEFWALSHAIQLRRFELEQEAAGHRIASRPFAHLSIRHRPRHVILAINHWRNGGVEQVMLDLAAGMRDAGVRTTLAVTQEDVSTDLANIARDAIVPVVGFSGNERAMVNFVRDKAVDAINFHHCGFALDELSRLKVKRVYTLHNSYIWFSDAQLRARALDLQRMDRIIAVSRQAADYATRWLAADPMRITTIPNGTRLQAASANIYKAPGQKVVNLPPFGYGFLNVGTLTRIKAQERLLRAFARVARLVPDIHLTFVGVPVDTVFYQELLELRVKLKLAERCTIIPGLERGEALKLMKQHHCFVLPSIVEGCSIAFNEALLNGLPAIVTDVGSARDMAELSARVTIVPPLFDPIEEMRDVDLARVVAAVDSDFEDRLAEALMQAQAKRDLAPQSAEESARLHAYMDIKAFIERTLTTLS